MDGKFKSAMPHMDACVGYAPEEPAVPRRLCTRHTACMTSKGGPCPQLQELPRALQEELQHLHTSAPGPCQNKQVS